MIDIVCVWVGTKYSEQYVINLYEGLKVNTTAEFRFNIITDQGPDISTKIPCRILPVPDVGINLSGPRKAWWYKIYMFSKECEFGKFVFYLDLDLVIIKNIDKFLSYEPKKFCICQDFNRQYMPRYHVSNSSIMKFRPKKYYQLWDEWIKDPAHYVRKFRGDQDYITDYFENKKHSSEKQWWPKEWAMSWKWELEKGGKKNNGTDRNSYHAPDQDFIIPSDCAIVVCHGDPKPADAHKEIVKYWHK